MSTKEGEHYSASQQPEPRLYNGAIISTDRDSILAEIRYNPNSYRDSVIDTSPVYFASVDRFTGETSLYSRIDLSHQWPDKFGEHLGIEDPRINNNIYGYTATYRNGRDWALPIVRHPNGVTLILTEADNPQGKNTCPWGDEVAYRPDSNRHSIIRVPLEELEGKNSISVDPKKMPGLDFGNREKLPNWVSEALGLTFYDPILAKEGLQLFHGQEIQRLKHKKSLVRYTEGFGLIDGNQVHLAEKPALTPEILDRLNSEEEDGMITKGQRVKGKDVVYVTGGYVETSDRGEKNLLVLATRHDAVSYLLSAPLREVLSHWNDGEIPWRNPVKLRLAQAEERLPLAA